MDRYTDAGVLTVRLVVDVCKGDGAIGFDGMLNKLWPKIIECALLRESLFPRVPLGFRLVAIPQQGSVRRVEAFARRRAMPNRLRRRLGQMRCAVPLAAPSRSDQEEKGWHWEHRRSDLSIGHVGSRVPVMHQRGALGLRSHSIRRVVRCARVASPSQTIRRVRRTRSQDVRSFVGIFGQRARCLRSTR